MGLFEELRQLSEQVAKRQPLVKGEEATKQALILPFLQTMGFDIYDPTEVQPEYTADFPGRTKGGQGEKVDYALRIGGQLAMLLECKAVDVRVSDHDAQLARYFNATPTAKLGILTNGIVYRFFTDRQNPNVMDSEPFYEFNVLNFSERDVDAMKPFTRGGFNPELLQNHAEGLVALDKAKALINDLLRNPSEDFIRFVIKDAHLSQSVITQKVIDRFAPIIKKAINLTLKDMMAASIETELTRSLEPQARESVEQQVPKAASAEPERVRLPAQEEKAVAQAIGQMCMEAGWKASLHQSGSAAYLTLSLAKGTWGFIRITSREGRKYLATNLTPEMAAGLADGFVVERRFKGGARVFFNDLADVARLRPLILAAYEKAATRRETASESKDEVTPGVQVPVTTLEP